MAYSDACLRFCTDVAEEGVPIAISDLVCLEFCQAIKRLVNREQLPRQAKAQFALGAWSTSTFVRERWLQFGVSQFESLLTTFAEVREIQLNRRILAAGVQIMALYNLDVQDAIDVASAQRIGVHHLATRDKQLLRVDSLTVLFTE